MYVSLKIPYYTEDKKKKKTLATGAEGPLFAEESLLNLEGNRQPPIFPSTFTTAPMNLVYVSLKILYCLAVSDIYFP